MFHKLAVTSSFISSSVVLVSSSAWSLVVVDSVMQLGVVDSVLWLGCVGVS
jgi:hypothetical protein